MFCQGDEFRIRFTRIKPLKAVTQFSACRLAIDGVSIVANIRRLPSKDFAQNGPETKHVGSFVEVIDFTQRLFWRHVGWCAHHATHLRFGSLRTEGARGIAANAT